MSNSPEELKYAETHEWARLEADGSVTIGITDHAQGALGDLVYVELPAVGDNVEAGEACAVVESVKAASDIYAPISGTVVAINEELEDGPEKVNEYPYSDGWLFRIDDADVDGLDEMMNAEDYDSSVD